MTFASMVFKKSTFKKIPLKSIRRPHIPNATYHVPRSLAFWFWRFFKGFYHTWARLPSWSCDWDHLIKFSFPHPKESPYEIKLISEMFENWYTIAISLAKYHIFCKTEILTGPYLHTLQCICEPILPGSLSRTLVRIQWALLFS